MIKKILAGLVAALAFVAMFFKSKADRAERKAETKRADTAELSRDTLQNINEDINKVEREGNEKLQNIDTSKRDHFTGW